MVTGVGDSPQGHDQPEPPASPDLEQAVPVQPQCRWWSSRRQWPPLAEEGYIDFKYQALHMPHFLSSLAALGLVGIYAVLFAEDVTLHGTIFPTLYWWRLSLSAGGGLLSVAACLLFRHAPRRARRFAVPLHLLMGLYWSFVLSLDPRTELGPTRAVRLAGTLSVIWLAVKLCSKFSSSTATNRLKKIHIEAMM